MKHRQLALVLLVIASAMTPAYAQQTTGSRMGAPAGRIPDRTGSAEDTLRIATSSFAECIVRTDRKRAERYIQTLPESPEAYDVGNALTRDECLMAGQLTMRDALFRGAIYERLYRSDFTEREITDFSAIPEIEYHSGIDLEKDSVGRSMVGLRQFADCVARTAPRETRALVLSRLASKQEQAAISALMPFFSGCISAESKVALGKTIVRGVLSEVVYRLSATAMQAVPVSR